MNKIIESKIKQTIAKEMGVKTNQVMLLESEIIDTTIYCNQSFAFNIRYNMYTNEEYKGDLVQYSKDTTMFVSNIKTMTQYKEEF